MWSLLALLGVGLISSISSAIVTANTAKYNVESQERINQENVQAQKDVNSQNIQAQAAINQQNIDYSREYAQNSTQWKMQDLEAAGLNPTLAAGGSGATPPTLSAPTSKAASQQAPMLDLSGISSAIMAMNNMMLTGYLMQDRNDIQKGRNVIMSDKNDVLRGLYRRKGAYLGASSGDKYLGSAKQLNQATNNIHLDKKWDNLLKDLEKMPYKYK